MDLQVLAYIAVAWVSVTSLLVLISHNWRVAMIHLALQYIGVFVLALLSWPLEMAVTILVAGWMASAVLGIATSEVILAAPNRLVGRATDIEQPWPASRLFRTLGACLVWLTVYSLAPKAAGWIPGVSLAAAWGGLILIGMGLLHLGLTAQPVRVVTGLLTVFSGFEILYAAVESSALLAGLLAATHMGLALAGAYLLIAPTTGGVE